MFMCCEKLYSVINSIYSGQQLYSSTGAQWFFGIPIPTLVLKRLIKNHNTKFSPPPISEFKFELYSEKLYKTQSLIMARADNLQIIDNKGNTDSKNGSVTSFNLKVEQTKIPFFWPKR